MQHIIYIISMMFLCTAAVRAQDIASKEALLMVHFGTTYDDARQKTIDAINARAQEAFPQLTVREAYTSPRVMKRLATKGIVKDTPTDALLRLRAEGCRTVTVQPTFVIDGVEMELLRRDVDRLRPFFDSISVGTPLLYSIDDAARVCQILVQRHASPLQDDKKGATHRSGKKGASHIVFVGHGTKGPATALYSQLDYMLSAMGYSNCHVATIEGYPTLQTVTDVLKAQHARRVTLVPLLFVAGDHANNDISSEWKEALQAEGFDVNVCLEGLGEVPQIQQLYIDKVKH